MRYGKFLPKNGTIGFVAPSFGCNIEPYKSAFQNAQKIFEEKGYRLALGPNCEKGDGIGISSTPRKCGAEFMEYYLSKENDILLSCGGGELMCEILDYVDFEKIKEAPPKWFMGFSDNTNLTFLLATLCDTASIYGPCAPAFGMEPWHASLEDTFSLLTGSSLCKKENSITVKSYEKWERQSLKDEAHPLLPYHVTEPQKFRIYEPWGDSMQKRGKGIIHVAEASDEIDMSGRLLGGCMDCLGILLGTAYDKVEAFQNRYREEGIIWFLEACDLNVMSIRRFLWEMDHAGWFRYTKGFLIGRPLQYDMPFLGLDQYEAVVGALEKYRVPIIMDADIGHLPPMMPLITGAHAQVSLKNGKLEVTMKLQ